MPMKPILNKILISNYLIVLKTKKL